MKKFYLTYKSGSTQWNQLSWSHNRLIMNIDLEDYKKGVMKMSKFKNWKDVKKELEFTPEEVEEMELEKEIIKATIEARKK